MIEKNWVLSVTDTRGNTPYYAVKYAVSCRILRCSAVPRTPAGDDSWKQTYAPYGSTVFTPFSTPIYASPTPSRYFERRFRRRRLIYLGSALSVTSVRRRRRLLRSSARYQRLRICVIFALLLILRLQMHRSTPEWLKKQDRLAPTATTDPVQTHSKNTAVQLASPPSAYHRDI